ncbi:MAG: SigB/SigF/SigG family RNA polymerase sigma factor [Clostridia bacterium]|nr:SigB/SigF/SigG family RNA polymerase sigma factor [Clostridia bacterium]
MKEETRALLREAKKGSKSAMESLVEANTGLIYSVIRHFQNRGAEADDLFQIGAVGLIRAIARFDLSYDVEFSTYAVPMIIGEIKRFLRSDGMIKVSRRTKELSTRVRGAIDTHRAKFGEEPTIEQLAEALGESAAEISFAMDATAAPESIYKSVGEKGALLADTIASRENCEEALTTRLSLYEAIDKLSEREKKIILLRYFREKTQSEVARMVGISQVQISRIEKKVLAQMRESLSG